MAQTKRLPPSEYGGSDTQRTGGIQPPPHEPTPAETLRLMYRENPDVLDEP